MVKDVFVSCYEEMYDVIDEYRLIFVIIALMMTPIYLTVFPAIMLLTAVYVHVKDSRKEEGTRLTFTDIMATFAGSAGAYVTATFYPYMLKVFNW